MNLPKGENLYAAIVILVAVVTIWGGTILVLILHALR